ncbi:hypothetical protein [Oleidesulfovibrio sp.]|uniref:hypothetical protein n=1 Tax=Oleidesulfovibrio sp. TaxID=2909707 RepID=UPI003A862D04
MQPKLSIHSRGTAKGFMRSVLRGVLTDDTQHLARALAEQESEAGLCVDASLRDGALPASHAGEKHGTSGK